MCTSPRVIPIAPASTRTVPPGGSWISPKAKAGPEWMSTCMIRTLRLMSGYAALTEVYEWLMPDAKLTPAGSVAAFSEVVKPVAAHGRVLDCSCGTGQLAVG